MPVPGDALGEDGRQLGIASAEQEAVIPLLVEPGAQAVLQNTEVDYLPKAPRPRKQPTLIMTVIST